LQKCQRTRGILVGTPSLLSSGNPMKLHLTVMTKGLQILPHHMLLSWLALLQRMQAIRASGELLKERML
jgi:hypothetical protein